MSDHPAGGGGAATLSGGDSREIPERKLPTHSPRVEAPPRTHRFLDTGLRAALVVVGLVAVAAWLFIALSHLDDRYGAGHVQGAWMALAAYANDGVLYPPLYDGEHYAGTRWMPLPMLVNAAAAQLTGEYLVSGKAVGVGLTLALLVLVLVVLRRWRCPWPLALALTGTIVATDAGRAVGSTVGGDVLPVLLQVGALALLDRNQDRRRTIAAGVLAGLALASKLTGVWAVLAVCTWLLATRRWRPLARFVAAFGATAVAVLGAVQVASGGRFGGTLLQLTFGGMGGASDLLRPFNQIVYQLTEWAQPSWALLGVALAGLVLAGSWRRFTPYQFALGWALVLLLGVFTDVGTHFNQLLDVVVLTVITVGQLVARLVEEGSARRTVLTAAAVFLVWVGGGGILTALVPDLRDAVNGEALERDSARPLAELVEPGETLLSEDPYIPLALGRTPTVLDPFMFRRLETVQPEAVDDMIARVERQEFDYIVLVEPLEEPDEVWWSDYHFGTRMMTTVEDAYAPAGMVDGYFVYRPKE